MIGRRRVHQAGGIVVRCDERGVRILVVASKRRQKRWVLPKGGVRDDEPPCEAALREVEEETGLVCELGPEAARTHYEVDGAPKEVRYFRMRAEGEAAPRNEVDEVRWATSAEAEELLDYPADRELVRVALGAL